MTNLPSTETMERISRQELADNLDAALDRVLRENIGLVITDEGEDDLVLCPSSWLDPFHTEDFGSVINCALRYAMHAEDKESEAVVRYLSVIAAGYWMKRRCRWRLRTWTGS